MLALMSGLILTTQPVIAASVDTTNGDSTAQSSSSSSTSTTKPAKPAKPVVPRLSLSGSTSIHVGASKKLTGKVTNISKAKPKWKSSNIKVLTVSQSGKIKGKKAGKTKITISYKGKSKSKTIKVTQQTNSTLNGKFGHAKKGQRITLVGNFKMNKNVKLPTKANVYVDARQATFTGKKGFFYGLVNKGLKWRGGKFYSGGHEFRLLRSTNATFNGLTFHQACGIGGHVFDLMGCKKIKIENSKFDGYGHTLNKKKLRKHGNHGEYAEAIQTDYANYNSGGSNFNRYGKHHFNGAPSTYITVTGNTFAPEYNGKKLISLAQVAIGEHDTISSNRHQIRHITFTHNTIKNALRLTGMGSDTSYFGAPVHFESTSSINISKNKFITTLKRARMENGVIISNQYGHMRHTKSVKIEKNTFSGYHASRSDIRLIARSGHSITGVKVKSNVTHGSRLIRRFGKTKVKY